MTGSLLTDQFGFELSQEIFAGLLTVFFSSYFLLCGNYKMFIDTRKPKKVAEKDIEKNKSL